MTRRTAQRGGARVAPAPPATWHDYYRDPVHDVVLVSLDKLHFRTSRFHLNRVSDAFHDADCLSAVIALFTEHRSKVVETFLDLCHGRPIVSYLLDSTTTSSLIKLIDDTRSHEIRRRLFATEAWIKQEDLENALRLANDNHDVSLAAKCIKRLAGLFGMNCGQQVCEVKYILNRLQLQWRAVLFDILLEDHGPCEDRYAPWDSSDDGSERVVIRHDWPDIAMEFEERAKIKAETNGTAQVETQSQAKRPAESQQPAEGARSGKTRRTGNR